MRYRTSESYTLRPIQFADGTGAYLDWFSDHEVVKYTSHGAFSDTESAFAKFFEEIQDRRHVVWAIVHHDDGHIGNVGLHRVEFVNRSAELGIVIGDHRHWNRGLGAQVSQAVVSHGFGVLNLHRVYCATAETNRGMLRVARALGMREEGRRKDALYLNGEWTDSIEFGLLKSEWASALR